MDENTNEQIGSHLMTDSGQPDGSTPTSAPSAPTTSTGGAPIEPPATLHDQPQAMNFPQNPDRSVKPFNTDRSISTKQPQQAPAPQITEQTHANDPAVQNAGRFYSIAEALAGGQHYKYVSDVNTGEIKEVPQKLTKSQIGMAIVLEALTGSLAGLAAGRGKGAGAAGAAGVEQGQKIVQAQRDREQQQLGLERENMGRHYQVAQANMQMLSLAQTVGRMDEQMHNDLVTRSADQIKYLRETSPELIAQEYASEDEAKDLQKYPFTEYVRIPQGTVPRFDKSGNQVWLDPFGKAVPEGTPGAHRALDNTYAIVRNGAKVSISNENGTTDMIKEAVKAGLLPESWLKASPGSELPVAMAASISHKVSALKAAEDDLHSYYNHLNGGKDDGGAASGDATMRTLFTDAEGNPDFDKMADAFIKHESPNNGDRGNRNNNPGNLKDGKFAKSQPGYAGSDGTFAKFSSRQAGRSALMSMLKRDMDKYGDMSPQGYVEAAYSPDSDNKPGQSKAYGDFLLKEAGYNTDNAKSQNLKYQPTDVMAEVKKDPSLINALDKFQGLLNQTGSREAAIGKLAEKDPRSAAKIARLYGGREAIHEFDLQQKLREGRMVAQIAIDKANEEGRNKQKLDNEAAEYLQKFLDVPQGFNFNPEMTEMKPQELQAELAKQGVDVPRNFASLYLAGHYRAPLSSFAPRVWNKGSKFEMDQQTAESYIQQFINPDFDATKYGPKQRLRNELVSAQSRDGGSIRNASTAVQHLAMLKEASDAYARHDMPLFNRIARWFNVEIKGDPKPADFKAIAEKVNAEVEKVAMGGNQPYVGQLEEGAKNLSSDFGPKTTDSIIGDYTRLMYGRMKAIDDNSFAELQEHLHNVSPEVTALFKQYKLDAPWEQGQKQTMQHTQKPLTDSNERPVVVNGQIVGYTKDGKTFSRVVTGN